MLAGLVYRFGPSDVPDPPRIVANGQCTAAVRERLLAAGGYRHAAGHMTDDAAQARGLAAEGWRVAFRDAGALLEVKMHDSRRGGLARMGALAGAAGGRAAGVAGRRRGGGVAGDGAAGPARPRRAARGRSTSRCSPSAARCWPACAGAYARRGPAFWLSPLADPLTAACLTLAVLRPRREWRGRTYS